MLELEQPAEARAVDPGTAEEVMRKERKGLKLVFPLLLMTSVLCLEMAVYRLWLDDRLFSAGGVLSLLLFTAFPFLGMIAFVAAPLWIGGLLNRWLPFL